MPYRFIVALLSLLFFSNAQAGNLSYQYLDIIKQDAELDLGGGLTLDGDLLGVAASYPINDTVFVAGSYAEGDVENIVDFEGWSISIGGHFPLNASTDLVADFAHSETKLSGGGISDTVDGESLEVGFRSKIDPKLEVFASYWADLDDSDSSIEFGGLVNITPTVALGLGFENGDDYDVTTIGLRVYFD
jgi:hypothetical protein